MEEKLIFGETTNTPETLGVTPRYVLQHNAISRGAHNMSATAQKVIAMAMALLPLDLSSLTAAFTFSDFCKALGYKRGGESFRLFHEAIIDCMGNFISIEIIDTETGKHQWKKYTWFSYSQLDEKTSVATMKFSDMLFEVLHEFKKVYSKINLKDLGELRSKYALHIFQLVISYHSLKGKGGNDDLEWYCERTIPELRKMMGVDDDIFKETKRFRKLVIENPVKEINAAGIGVEITAVCIKKGRYIASIRFECRETPRYAIAKHEGKKSAPLELPESHPKIAEKRLEKECQHLRELYPDEFALLYEEELNAPSALSKDNFVRMGAAQHAAITRLKEKYGIVK
jgi:hypothetical protein